MPLRYSISLFADKQESEYVVLEETSVRYEGKSLDFVWEDQGLELHIDDEALSPDTSSCDIKISAVTSADLFKFPEGLELASGVYKIDCHCHFIKPVKLKIKHNAVESSTSKLHFAVSSCKRPPYNFYCGDEAEFEAHYGTTIKLSLYSLRTILKEITFGSSQYGINLYSNDSDLKKPVDIWKLYIVATKSNSKLEESAKSNLSNKIGQRLSWCTSLNGEFDSSEIIKFEPEQASHLEITPQNPLRLKKSSIDNYSVGSTPLYVGLEVRNKEKTRIKLKISIRGLKGEGDDFLTFTSSFTPGELACITLS